MKQILDPSVPSRKNRLSIADLIDELSAALVEREHEASREALLRGPANGHDFQAGRAAAFAQAGMLVAILRRRLERLVADRRAALKAVSK